MILLCVLLNPSERQRTLRGSEKLNHPTPPHRPMTKSEFRSKVLLKPTSLEFKFTALSVWPYCIYLCSMLNVTWQTTCYVYTALPFFILNIKTPHLWMYPDKTGEPLAADGVAGLETRHN